MIDVDPNDFVIARLSLDKFQNLMDFMGNISRFIAGIIRTVDSVTLVIQKGGWRRIEFDYDEGHTREGYRLITVTPGPESDEGSTWPGIVEKLAERTIKATLLSAFSKYLVLVPQNQLEDALKALSN
ncbi:MAG: hypothetical protein ACFFD4_13335 [Candidatus Odinarchaeota archaeon]